MSHHHELNLANHHTAPAAPSPVSDIATAGQLARGGGVVARGTPERRAAMTQADDVLCTRILARCVRDDAGHLIWTGSMRQGLPVLYRDGTPISIRAWMLRRSGEEAPRLIAPCQTGGARCVDPDHIGQVPVFAGCARPREPKPAKRVIDALPPERSLARPPGRGETLRPTDEVARLLAETAGHVPVIASPPSRFANLAARLAAKRGRATEQTKGVD